MPQNEAGAGASRHPEREVVRDASLHRDDGAEGLLQIAADEGAQLVEIDHVTWLDARLELGDLVVEPQLTHELECVAQREGVRSGESAVVARRAQARRG